MLWALLVGVGTGALIAVVLVLTQSQAKTHLKDTKRTKQATKRTMPYAPFLCIGTLAVLLYGML